MIEMKTADLIGPEEWRQIPGFAGYEASTHGRVRISAFIGWKGKQHQPRIKAMQKDQHGYMRVKLKGKYYRAHRIIALTFFGESLLPEVNHKNGIKQDNRPENLEWCSASHNAKHACTAGLWDRRGGTDSRSFKGWIQAERNSFGLILGGNQHLILAGFSPSEVSKCLLGKRKTHNGFSFIRMVAKNV